MSTLVLALNPSIDAEWRVDDVLWEEKNNVRSERRWAGGKGINVARWLKHLGGKPKLLLPLGGLTGKELNDHLRREHISAKVIGLRQPTRVNVIVTTATGRQIRFNPPGPELSESEWRKLLKLVELALRRTKLLVLSGSLPRGVKTSAYAQLVRMARRHHVRTVLDCDGQAFAAGVKARPFLVKPNEHELAQWWNQPLRGQRQLLAAARALSHQTHGWVLVSRGAKGGLLVNVTENFVQFARTPQIKARNTVGAGDALLAAVARQIELGSPPEDWLQHGLAAGCAATQCRAGELPS